MKRFMLVSLMSCVLVSGQLFASSSNENNSDSNSWSFSMPIWSKTPEAKLFAAGLVAPLALCAGKHLWNFGSWQLGAVKKTGEVLSNSALNQESKLNSLGQIFKETPSFSDMSSMYTVMPLVGGATLAAGHSLWEGGRGHESEKKKWSDTLCTALKRSTSFVAGLGLAAGLQYFWSK